MNSMKKDEIYEYLKNTFGLNFNKECLNKPETDFVVDLLSDIMDKMKLIKKEKIMKMNINEMKHFQFTGIQDKTFLYIKFTNSIQNFLKNTLNISNFQSEDIFSPTSKKLKTILLALINYNKFNTEEQNYTKQLKESYNNSFISLADIKSEFESKKKLLNELKDQNEEEKILVSQLINECENISLKNNQLFQRMDQQDQNLSSLTNNLNNLGANIKNVDQSIETMEERIKIIKSKTIINPELLINVKQLLKKENERQKTNITQMETSNEDLEKNLSINEKKLQNLRILEKNIIYLEEILNIHSTRNESKEIILDKIKELYNHKSKIENEDESINRKIEIKLLDYKMTEEDFVKNEEHLQKSFESSIEQNKFLKEKYENESKNFLELSEIIKHQTVICKRLEKQIEEKDKTIIELYNKCVEDFENLDNLSDLYYTNLTKELDL